MGQVKKAAAMLAACWRLRRFRYRTSTAEPSSSPAPSDGKIDAVYLWRDARDHSWISAYAGALAELDPEERQTCNLPDLRYIEIQRKGAKLDLLRWSLRSLSQHFVDLGQVHIVSDTPPPSWLDVGHQGLTWHTVRELIDDSCPYPSFSSQAIESYLYRIPGLSERFVYINDDFFLSRNIGKDAFFRDGKILVRFGRGISPQGDSTPLEPGDTSAHKQSNELLNKAFQRERRLTLKHRPYPLTRSLYTEAESRFPDAVDATRRHRFRSTRTFALHSCLIPYLALYEERASAIMPTLWAKDMIHWGNDSEKNRTAFRRIVKAKRDDIGFCVQANAELCFSEASRLQFEELMAELFPTPCEFERVGAPGTREGIDRTARP